MRSNPKYHLVRERKDEEAPATELEVRIIARWDTKCFEKIHLELSHMQ